MKKIYLFLAAMASVALVGCTSDNLLQTEATVDEAAQGQTPILFSAGTNRLTRADLYGSAAATKLGNKFVVYGTKHATAEDKTAGEDVIAYNNFQVAFTANTAGKTASNTSDWEYVGLTPYTDNGGRPQSIKYWDYSAAGGYTFYAFSSSDISYPAAATDKVVVTKTTSDATSLYNKGYAVTVKSGATLNNLYFSDRTPVAKANFDKTVSLTFRNIGSKVRVGFYETIPGYTVQIDKFYIDEDATAAVTDFAKMKDNKTDGFYAALQNVKSNVDQTLNVTYYDNTDATIENRPKLTNPDNGYYYSLKLGGGVLGTNLSDNAAAPTWDQTGGAYTPVFPFEGNTNPLLLKLDFTMTPDDGSNDVIHVRGARAIVPAQYVQWKSNFAYTYIFKISDKTNGTTGDVDGNDDPTDPEGLKPITFDAVVVDVDESLQQTITSVATNSITTYAEGAIADEYTKGKPIYIAIENNLTHAVITPTAIGPAAGNAQIYALDKATTEASMLAWLTGSPVDITPSVAGATETPSIVATVPLVDGTNPAIANVKFTPSAAGYYAYVYTRTAYVAPTYTIQSTETYDSSCTYYMLSGSGAYYAVSVPTAAAFNANKTNLYIQATTGTPGVYDVKIIKVQ